MSRRFQPIVVLTLFVCCACPLFAVSSSEKGEGNAARTHYQISFRTQKPMVAHLKTDKDVAETTKLLKQIGCKVTSNQHDGHVDLAYECRYWKSVKFRKLEEVKQWEKWLNSKGFFVVHNSPPKEHRDTLQYRLQKWKTLHFKTKQENEAYEAMFKMLGCEVKSEKHGDHDDLMVRCPSWQTLGVPSDEEAHAWIGVLRKLGFQTAHEHAK